MGEPFDLRRAADRRRRSCCSASWISAFGLPQRRRQRCWRSNPAHQRAAIEMPYDIAAMMIMFTVFIVGVFYCLDALHGERRDRSILFWKSLPVSDLTTVLSKAIIPLVILPLITFVIIVATQFIMLLISSAACCLSGLAGTTWTNFPVFQHSLILLYGSDRNRALACADLRLAAAGFRMGAARDVSLGGVTVARDRVLRSSRSTHRIFYQC